MSDKSEQERQLEIIERDFIDKASSVGVVDIRTIALDSQETLDRMSKQLVESMAKVAEGNSRYEDCVQLIYDLYAVAACLAHNAQVEEYVEVDHLDVLQAHAEDGMELVEEATL